MKVSIITTSLNSEATIHDTLTSVQQQEYEHIEHIIIDGGSTDQTCSIIRSFPHISKWTSEPDQGAYDAMNKGIAQANGDIVGILNSDDLFASNDIISNIVQLFQQNKGIACVYGDIAYFNDTPQEIVRYWKSKSYYPTFFEDGEAIPHPSLFVRKQVYDTIEPYNPIFKISGDYEFTLRALKIHGYHSYYWNRLVVNMRNGGISTRGLKSYWISTIELAKAWTINDISYPTRLYFLRPLQKLKQLVVKYTGH